MNKLPKFLRRMGVAILIVCAGVLACAAVEAILMLVVFRIDDIVGPNVTAALMAVCLVALVMRVLWSVRIVRVEE